MTPTTRPPCSTDLAAILGWTVAYLLSQGIQLDAPLTRADLERQVRALMAARATEDTKLLLAVTR